MNNVNRQTAKLLQQRSTFLQWYAGMLDVSASYTVAESARHFRATLKAMARPGTAQQLLANEGAPAPLGTATSVAAVNLLDFQTPVWLSPKMSNVGVIEYLRFHTGATVTPDRKRAAFALLQADELERHLPHFSIGTDEYPDRSTTLVVQSNELSATPVMLRGPGIQDKVQLAVNGVSTKAWQKLSENSSLFPLGVDVMFTIHDTVIGLPRSTRIALAETA
jgi:alpha-D-ribose 1-methylphosphonate 5-triphosphate synthase subunit PhnH